MQHINYIFGKLWPFGWSESICTLYKFSYSTSSIDPLHLCNSEPILHSIGIHIRYSISIITLQGLHPSAGPRAYTHYIRPHKAHPLLTNWISAKVQSFQLLCRHTYNMQHIIYILQSIGLSAGPRAYAHYISPHIVHPPLTHCISTKMSSSSTL